MSAAGEEQELVGKLRAARAELSRIVEALQRGATPGDAGTRELDAALGAVHALLATRDAAALDERTRAECAVLRDLVGIARGLAGAQLARAHTELADLRAVRARLGRQRERSPRSDARNCDVSA